MQQSFYVKLKIKYSQKSILFFISRPSHAWSSKAIRMRQNL